MIRDCVGVCGGVGGGGGGGGWIEVVEIRVQN